MVFLIFIFNFFVNADIIYLNDGEEYSGKLEKIEGETVFFRVYSDNSLRKLKKSEIETIKLSMQLEGYDKKFAAELNDTILNEALSVDTSNIPEPDSGYIILYEGIELTPKEYSIRRIIKIVSDEGTDIGNQKFMYKKDSEKLKFNFARTTDKDGKLFHIYENAIQEESIRTDPEYTRRDSIKFTMPEVRTGNVIDFKITKTKIKDIQLEEPFLKVSFISTVPIIKKEVIISGFNGVDGFSEIIVNNNGNFEIPIVSRRVSGDKIIYSSVNIPEYFSEVNMSPVNLFAPTLYVGVSSKEAQLKEILTIQTDDDLSIIKSRFKGQYMKFNSTNFTEQDEEAFLLSVYEYLAKYISSVNILPTSYYFKAKKIKDIIRNKRGNYLDKNFLFISIIGLAKGFETGLYFLSPYYSGGSEDTIRNLNQFYIPLSYIKTPSGKEYFIDAYSDVITWGYIPSYYIGNTGILITKSGVQKRLIKNNKPEADQIEKVLNVKVNKNGDAEVVLITKFFGVNAEYFRELKDSSNDEIKNYFNEIISEIAENAHLDSYRLFFIRDLKSAPGYELKFTIKDWAKVKGGLILTKLLSVNYSAYEVGTPDRFYPMHWDNSKMSVKKISIEFPKNMKFIIKYIPEDINFSDPDFSYKNHIEMKGNIIEFSEEFIRSGRFLPPEKYLQYKEMIEKMSDFSKQMVILEKK